MNPFCVVVIPYVEWNEYLAECVASCLQLDYDNFHLVLLPDKESPRPLLPQEKVTVIVTGDRSIAAKRNVGIARFPEAVYYALIDSDAFPEPSWLANGIRFLTEHPRVWAVGGPNLSPPGELFLQRVVGNAQESFLVSGPLAFAKQMSSGRYCTSLHSCNLIMPKVAFDVVGSFDEGLFTGEDRNLCDRIRESGHSIYFEPGVVVYHHNRRLWKQFFFQRLTYGHGSIGIGSRSRSMANMLLYLPLIWTGVAGSFCLYGFLGGNLLPLVCFIVVNLAAAIEEGARTSKSTVEIPFTVAAIVVCYVGTTLGLVLALLGVNPKLKRVYINSNA